MKGYSFPIKIYPENSFCYTNYNEYFKSKALLVYS